MSESSESLRVLALEPYYGGSHRAFLDGWRENSRHRFTLLTLPPYKWKWRMRHGAVTLAQETAELARSSAVPLGGSRGNTSWDVVFASDMLNLAEWRGLAPAPVAGLPAVAYFHENQLTYPVRVERERDLHFALTNLTTALAAKQVWWNSTFHRDEFLEATCRFLKRMPDYQPIEIAERIRRRSVVEPPGIRPLWDRTRSSRPRTAGPLRILWAARWEFDKNPEDFFAALKLLRRRGVDFRLHVVGESFRDVPEIFEEARTSFADRIERWGYQSSREDYEETLLRSDVVVSTARHEFFGISVLEAILAGCYPLLPERLSYPEILADVGDEERPRFFYDGTVRHLATRLEELAARLAGGDLWSGDNTPAYRAAERFTWPRRGPELDDALQRWSAPPL